ncbi:desumoylating isopeptidase 2-like protein [Leptotrombidium deliense]|uniref:Desumoylating isopeptidase 2-like protein n=1 Tax=Leptotrombidium deliense TaxID=299467 RepID=A0A443SJ10_9ACAR|nr:desumoylating isopeptidase 2-like protein [Leptotrombidium deliense]
MARQQVKINVYDMCSFNSYTSALGVGVYHSGVHIYNTEFGYGGHPFEFTGVFEIEPRDEEALGEDTFKYKESLLIGYTDFTDDEVREIVKQIGNEFRGDQYHLLHKNCNHFTDIVCKTLCGKGIPSWINRLAYISTCVPFLERCLPKEFLTPVALEESVKERVRDSDEFTQSFGFGDENETSRQRPRRCIFDSTTKNSPNSW